MSVIFSVRKNGKAFMFSDTQKTYGGNNQKRVGCKKLFETEHGILGIVGDDESHYDIVRLLSQFDNPFSITNWPTNFDYTVLFINKTGTLYEIDSPGIVSIQDDVIYASGSGESWAIAAAYGWRLAKGITVSSATDRAIVKLGNCAVSCAIHHDLHCGGLIECVTLKTKITES